MVETKIKIKYCIIEKKDEKNYPEGKHICPTIKNEDIFDYKDDAMEKRIAGQSILCVDVEEIDTIGEVCLIKGRVKKILKK